MKYIKQFDELPSYEFIKKYFSSLTKKQIGVDVKDNNDYISVDFIFDTFDDERKVIKKIRELIHRNNPYYQLKKKQSIRSKSIYIELIPIKDRSDKTKTLFKLDNSDIEELFFSITDDGEFKLGDYKFVSIYPDDFPTYKNIDLIYGDYYGLYPLSNSEFSYNVNLLDGSTSYLALNIELLVIETNDIGIDNLYGKLYKFSKELNLRLRIYDIKLLSSYLSRGLYGKLNVQFIIGLNNY